MGSGVSIPMFGAAQIHLRGILLNSGAEVRAT